MDLDSIFTSTPMKFLFAFFVVFLLIGATAWVIRRFGADRLAAQGTRGRQPRLAVIDQAQVDARRRLLIIRRDNVEHLVMVGGPTDVVVETNIVRGIPANRETAPARNAGATDTLPRPVPLDDATMWPLAPEPGPRPRPAIAIPEDVGQWPLQPEPAPRQQRAPAPDPLSGLAAELSARPAPQPAMRPEPLRVEPVRQETMRAEPPRVAPQPMPPVAAPMPVDPNADHNLAEMAIRLEAALRRPGVDPRQSTEAMGRTEPVMERAPRAEPRAPRPEPKIEQPKPEPAKPAFTSLEQEMASLLGRPTGKGS